MISFPRDYADREILEEASRFRGGHKGLQKKARRGIKTRGREIPPGSPAEWRSLERCLRGGDYRVQVSDVDMGFVPESSTGSAGSTCRETETGRI